MRVSYRTWPPNSVVRLGWGGGGMSRTEPNRAMLAIESRRTGSANRTEPNRTDMSTRVEPNRAHRDCEPTRTESNRTDVDAQPHRTELKYIRVEPDSPRTGPA